MIRRWSAAAALLGVAAIAAGCGSSNSNSGSSSSGSGASTMGTGSSNASGTSGSSSSRYSYGAGSQTSPSTSGAVAAAKIGTRQLSLGTVLVGPNGRTLYLFEKDKGPKSSCIGACAQGWPPLMSNGAPKAGTGVKASLLSTFKRPGGGRQVAYDGHPLYYFVQDRKPGQDTGEGLKAFGAEWYVLAPNGKKIDES
jgi:predicted lipoprotein with Yx(FWY)xxD motif